MDSRPATAARPKVTNQGESWGSSVVPTARRVMGSVAANSADTVLGLTPDHARLKDLGQDVGVIHIAPDAGANPERPGAVVRAFAAPMGNPEDPVTGSLNASLAQWLIGEGLAPTRYLVAQGECLGRAGRVYIHQDERGQVWVGGHTVTCIEGTALL